MNEQSSFGEDEGDVEYESDYEYTFAEDDCVSGDAAADGRKRQASTYPPRATLAVAATHPAPLFERLGSRCVRCNQENHAPVRDCTQAQTWTNRHRELLTVSPAILQRCVSTYIETVAERLGVTAAVAGVLCRQGHWNMNQIQLIHRFGNQQRVERLQTPPVGTRIVAAGPPIDLLSVTTELSLRRDGNGDTRDEKKHQDELVVGDKKMKAQDTSATGTCSICFEECPAHRLRALECEHGFCLDCWRNVIEVGIGETHEAAMMMTCPTQDCQVSLSEAMIEKVAPDLLPRFFDHQLRSFVESNHETLRWCPGPDCDHTAVKPRGDRFFEDLSSNFLCGSCGTDFCFKCGLEAHNGRECRRDFVENVALNRALGHLARDVEERDLLESKRDDKKRKQCPKCQVYVEKIGGCNRMVCKCRHPFCWLCLGEYRSYGSHFCGRTSQPQPPRDPGDDHIWVDLEFLLGVVCGCQVENETQELSLKLRDLYRYAHCYNRYVAHDQGQRFAEESCACLGNRVENYTQMAGFSSGTEGDFIRAANETLAASRCLLKYSCCSVYHSRRVDEEDNDNSHLGFLHLERLERFTEELSEISENALSRQDRKKVLELTSAVKKSMGAVEDFEDIELLGNVARKNLQPFPATTPSRSEPAHSKREPYLEAFEV